MTNRRMDAVYFSLLVVVSVIAYYAANRPSEETATLELPSFDPPEFVLAEPFELPFKIVKFETRTPPKLHLSDNMESVLVEVRSALLESAKPVEVQQVERLVAIVE